MNFHERVDTILAWTELFSLIMPQQCQIWTWQWCQLAYVANSPNSSLVVVTESRHHCCVWLWPPFKVLLKRFQAEQKAEYWISFAFKLNCITMSTQTFLPPPPPQPPHLFVCLFVCLFNWALFSSFHLDGAEKAPCRCLLFDLKPF